MGFTIHKTFAFYMGGDVVFRQVQRFGRQLGLVSQVLV
jgi:hypothetical protein